MTSPVAVETDTHVGLDTYTLLTDGIIQGSVKQSIIEFFDPTGGLPIGPELNDRYISSATANGWTINAIQYWNGLEWNEVVPQTGETLYNTATVGTFPLSSVIWDGTAWVADGGGSGDVSGPGASTVGAIAIWNDVTGTTLADSTVIVTGTGDVQIPTGGCLQVNSLVTACRDGNDNLVFGDGNLSGVTIATGAIAIGDGAGTTLSTGTNNVIIGTGADTGAGTSDAVAIGNSATASGFASLAVGFSSSATFGSAVAIGYGSSSASEYAVTLGRSTSATADSAIAIGRGASATGTSGVAIGPGASAGFVDSVAIGKNATTTTTNTIVLGTASETVVIPGALQMPVGDAVGTTNILSVTSVPGAPTDVTGDPGGLTFDTTSDLLYVFNGTGWDAYAPANRLSSESISIAGAGNNPDLSVATTFVSTTAAASGTLADGTSVGQIKYIVISAYVGDYVMTVTNGIDAAGAAITTITYDSAGLGSTLTWDGTNWIIFNTGGVIA